MLIITKIYNFWRQVFYFFTLKQKHKFHIFRKFTLLSHWSISFLAIPGFLLDLLVLHNQFSFYKSWHWMGKKQKQQPSLLPKTTKKQGSKLFCVCVFVWTFVVFSMLPTHNFRAYYSKRYKSKKIDSGKG